MIDFGMRDPCSMETIDKLIPNRNKQEELEKFYQDKFKETVGNLASESIDMHVELIVELIAMVVDRSDLQACLNGQRLLIELIQSSTEEQLGRFKTKLDTTGLALIAKLVEKQNATILKHQLSVDVSSSATAVLLSSQPIPIVPHAAPTASIDGSDDEEEYDFSDTESTTSSVSYIDETHVLVDKMPCETTVNNVKQHFQKFKESMVGRVLFIKGSNGIKARLTFKTSESAFEAIEMMNGSFFPNSSTPIVVKLWVNRRKQKLEPKASKQLASCKKSNSESSAIEPVIATDIYVGNLQSSVTEDDIRMHFKTFEPHIQRVLLIKDSRTKQLKGFAKITFASLQAAQMVIEKFHKSQLPQCKQRLVVNLWKSEKETDEMPASPTKSIPEEDDKDAEKKSRQRRKQKVPIEQVTAVAALEDEPKEVGLIIENVSIQISGDQLRQMLEGFGNVKHYSIIAAPTGKTVYKAEVYFGSKEQADEAISHLNGHQLAGKKIVIQYLSMATRETSIEAFGVYIGKIPKALLKPELEQIFAKYGKISGIYFNSDKRFAFVNYFKMEDAKAALDMSNREMYGSKLEVNIASKKTTESTVEVDFLPSLPAPASSPDPKSPNFSFGRPKESSPRSPSSFTVRVKYLSPLTTKEALTKLVERYGSLTSPVHLIKGDPPYAYVNYATIEAAKAACSHLRGQQLDGNTLQVKMKNRDEITPFSPTVSPMTSTVPPYTTTLPPQSPYSPAIKSIPPLSPSQHPILSTVAPSIPKYFVKLRHASARFNKYLHKRMDQKLREFASFGGSVRWSNYFLTIKAPSMDVLNQFEIDVLNDLEEDKVALSSEDWNKLMFVRPDKTSLFHQLVLPYRTNPNVYIERHDTTLSIYIVGMRDAVQDVKITILSELNKEIIVEE